MKIIRGLHNIRPEHKGSVITIGNFDGVHLGHQMLINETIAAARELALPSTLITFEPQPREYFRGNTVPARLTRFREKITLINQLGIDQVVCLEFNERTASIPAEVVIAELLVNRLGVRHLIVGDDFRFGRGARGDSTLLRQAGEKHGFKVRCMSTKTHGDERLSSSQVRAALEAGDFSLAESLLGRPYFIMGRVSYGRQLGRQLGSPTANIRLQRYRAALNGVFAVTVNGLDKRYLGVANIGIRPTVDGKEPLLEVHIFDFDEDIYGELLTVTFHAKIREEKKFDGLDALKTQIGADIVTAKNLLVDV